MQLAELVESNTKIHATVTPLEEFNWAEVEHEQFKLKNKKNLSLIFDELKSSEDEKQLMLLYEQSLTNFRLSPLKDEIVNGKILSISNNIAMVDINCRESGYIDIKKESTEYLDYLTVGNTITAKVISTVAEKGFINLSYTDAVYQSKQKEILESINKNVAYLGEVKSLLPGGYLVTIDGIETFMPGSLAGVNKLHDFEVLLGKSLYVVPINYERNNIVVSHRDYLHKLIPGKIEELKNGSSTLIKGFVTGSTPYGIFCEFNECLTGMILASELTEDCKARHTSRQIKPGEVLEFYIKEIISNKKIILTQIFKEDPWDTILDNFKILSTVKGKVTTIKEYGAFIQIAEGLTGLLHSSEIEGKKISEGSEIDVKITKIDTSTKKIFLSIK